MSLRRLIPIIASAIIGLPTLGSACEISLGFAERSTNVTEGTAANIDVVAEFMGPISKDYELTVRYHTAVRPQWNGQDIGSPSSARKGVDYQEIFEPNNQIRFSKSNDSENEKITKTISVGTYAVAGNADQKFYVNLEVTPYPGGHKTKEEACETNPAVHFKRYGFFHTVYIKDDANGNLSNHWLYGNR